MESGRIGSKINILNCRERKKAEMYDVVIIGSGPAGLSAVIYAQRARLETLVIESAPMSGGQILNT